MTNIGYAHSCTEYSVHFGQFFFFNQTENVFFPHQWTRVCPSLDLVTSKETPMFFFLGPWWTVDGGQLLGEEEYKREEDEFRLDNIREVVKKSKWKFKMAFAIRGPTPLPPP